MKESKKMILRLLSSDGKKSKKFDLLVLNLALQKIDSDNFDFDGQAVYTSDRKRLVYCLSDKDSFTIAEGVEVIGEMAFRRKKALKNVIIPSTVTKIENDAFYDCDGLENVYIPSSVTTVEGYAFAECDSLKTVTFAGTPNNINRHVFDDSDGLHRITVPEKAVQKFRKALHYKDEDDEYIIVAAKAAPSADGQKVPEKTGKQEQKKDVSSKREDEKSAHATADKKAKK